MVILFAVLSAFTYGCADFIGGLATRNNPVSAVVVWSQTAGIVIALVAIPLIGGPLPTVESWLWGMAAGLAGVAGLGLLYQGLATGFAAIVSPAAAVTGATLPVIFGFLIGERPGLFIWAGVALVLGAMFLLSIEKEESRGEALKSLRMGIFSGLGFGVFFILLSRTGSDSGIWPLLAARSASVPVLLIVNWMLRKPMLLNRNSYISTLGAGVVDMAANVFYLLATRSGLLITASILTLLYPVPTVLLQRMVFKEHLSTLRIIGLILAIGGMVLIGMS